MQPYHPPEEPENHLFSDAASYQNKDDSHIWDAFRSGNESAFIYIYETNFDRLYAYGWRICRKEDTIKDAIQDLFIELRRSRANLGPTDSIKFYLFSCLKRKLIRENSKWDASLEALDPDYHFDFTISHEQILIDYQIDEEMKNKLNQAVTLLSPRKKEVVYYFFYEGLSYAQIQEIMGLANIKSARNLIYKALDFLREVIK